MRMGKKPGQCVESILTFFLGVHSLKLSGHGSDKAISDKVDWKFRPFLSGKGI